MEVVADGLAFGGKECRQGDREVAGEIGAPLTSVIGSEVGELGCVVLGVFVVGLDGELGGRAVVAGDNRLVVGVGGREVVGEVVVGGAAIVGVFGGCGLLLSLFGSSFVVGGTLRLFGYVAASDSLLILYDDSVQTPTPHGSPSSLHSPYQHP